MDEDQEFARAPRRLRLGVGAVLAAIVVALAVAVGTGVVRTSAQPDSVAVAPASVSAADLYVHVSGSVRAPGLYLLAPDARVVDAVAAAGGFAPDAATDAVNLARAVTDGEQLVIASTATGDAAATVSAADTRIDLNNATASDLEALPRIGPALAARIIDWREENGRFTSVDDLSLVSGIGEKMLGALVPLVRV